MQEYRFIVWADSHYDMLGAKCVTLQDTELVERQIFERSKDLNCDFTLFAGDRFLKREPCDEVKVKADRVIYDHVHNGNIPHFNLIGNHDWPENSRKWHTAHSLKLFNNVFVMDEAKTYKTKEVCIHALPADFEMNVSKYEFDKNCLNIFVFHDTVRGAYMDEDRSMVFDSGISLENFDLPQFDIVFAGDIHVRQKFNLVNTRGGYLGSLTQRTRADSNKPRGWTEVRAYRRKITDPWDFDINFVPTKNLFTRLSFNVSEKTQFSDLILDKSSFDNQLVEVRLIGLKVDVDRIADNLNWAKIEKDFNARKVEIIRGYETVQSDVVVDLTQSRCVTDDLDLYLKSNFAGLGNLRFEAIVDAVKRLSHGV